MLCPKFKTKMHFTDCSDKILLIYTTMYMCVHTYIILNKRKVPDMMGHTSNTRTLEAKAERTMSSRRAWAIDHVSKQKQSNERKIVHFNNYIH